MRAAGFLAATSLIATLGCSTTQEAALSAPEDLSSHACVSAEGQRFITYCASPEAAELARRQQVIERAGDDEVLPEDMVPLTVEGAPLRGPSDAGVTIHLYSDLRCPGCRALYEDLVERVDQGDELRLVFRHIPTDTVAEALALAAIAADEQGLFWDFADAVVRRGDDLRVEELAGLGEELGLDLDAWQREISRDRTARTLAADGVRADRLGVVAAPTLFINGRRHVGPLAGDELDDHLDAELKQVRAMAAAGLASHRISWRRILQNYRPVDWEQVAEADADLETGLRVSYVPRGDSPHTGAADRDTLVTVVLFVDIASEPGMDALGLWISLLSEYGRQGLQLVIKHRPQGPEDSYSFMAARAAAAAHLGDAYWEFIVGLLEGTTYPEEPGLPAAQDAVDADLRLAANLDITRPPEVFINGIRLSGRWSFDELAPLIDDQIALGATLQELTGHSGEALYRDLVEVNGE